MAHVAVVGAVLAYTPTERDREPPERPPIIELLPAATTEPTLDEALTPIEVAIISPSEIPSTAPPDASVIDTRDPAPTPSTSASTSSPDRRSIATTTRPTESGASGSTSSPSSTATTGDGSPQRSPYFDLRKGRIDLQHGGTFTSFDPSAGPGPERQIRTGQLEQNGATHKSEQGVFTAKVEKDGNVSLTDAKNFNVRFALPRPKMIGNAFTQWYASDKGPDGQRGTRTLENEVGGSIDKGNPALNDKGDRSRTVIVPVFRGGFDITDGLIRKLTGADPYASKKLAFLDATRDERAQIGAKYRAGQLAQTDLIVRKNLETLWSNIANPTARKQALFELWDEAVETGDAKVVEAGATARRQIIGFIRARLPANSPAGYTAAELSALNAKKQSKAMFAPYE